MKEIFNLEADSSSNYRFGLRIYSYMTHTLFLSLRLVLVCTSARSMVNSVLQRLAAKQTSHRQALAVMHYRYRFTIFYQDKRE